MDKKTKTILIVAASLIAVAGTIYYFKKVKKDKLGSSTAKDKESRQIVIEKQPST